MGVGVVILYRMTPTHASCIGVNRNASFFGAVMLSERDVEKYLVRRVKDEGGLCWKFISSVGGVPDRLVILPMGKIAFIEVKRPGCLPRKLQVKRILQLSRLGFFATWVDCRERVDEVIDEICAKKLSNEDNPKGVVSE